MSLRIPVLLLFLALAGCAGATRPDRAAVAVSPPRTPVILISIDGFRPDYLDRGITPNLSALAAEGARGQMTPSFPSITFPNHYTLVTGLRPDRHGIVGNTMTDPAIPGVTFKMSNHAATTDRRWWDEAEPIWVTAEKHAIRSATMFWPGSEAPIHGVRPTYSRRFDSKVTDDARVDRVLGWLDRPAPRRPQFLTLYFDKVDHFGHKAGPHSAAVDDAVAHVDAAIGRLTAGLAARHIDADLVIVADHGMADIGVDRIVRLDRIAPAGSYRWVTGGAYAGVDPVAGQETRLTDALLAPHDHMRCWLKSTLPERFHYGRNPRVPAIICLADVGWVIADGPPGADPDKGTHGFDPEAPEMRALFIAHGPDFVRAVLPTFDNVDVYPLVMRLLALDPLPNDGTIAPLAPALRR